MRELPIDENVVHGLAKDYGVGDKRDDDPPLTRSCDNNTAISEYLPDGGNAKFNAFDLGITQFDHIRIHNATSHKNALVGCGDDQEFLGQIRKANHNGADQQNEIPQS